MIYRGYEIKQGKFDGFNADGQIIIGVEGWGVYRLGKLVRICDNLKEAKDFVEGQTQDVLYRPSNHRYGKKTEFDDYKKIMEGNGHDKNRSDN